MATEPPSFRDHFVSLFQSAADELMRKTAGVVGLASRPGLENALVAAVAQVASLKAGGTAALPDDAPDGIDEEAWKSAKLAFQLMEARAQGETQTAQSIVDELKCGSFDPGWATTITSFAQYFGSDGGRATIPYIPAAQVGKVILPLQNDATIALLADWGTGTDIAVNLLKEIALLQPDIVIHLGDIYYSGTPEECDVNFKRIVDTVLERNTRQVAVYTLAGNHDMYSGGAGYYNLLATLNAGPAKQPASFFCLRNDHWQLLAMDTGLHDYIPVLGNDMLTFLEPDEEDWIAERLEEFPGKTILLSHHQLFSAFSQIGDRGADGALTAYNPNLLKSFQRFTQVARQPIAAWFWGHEHTLSVYEPYLDLNCGRCIGHAAVPVIPSDTFFQPIAGIADPPRSISLQLPVDTQDHVYAHGFTVISLAGDGSAVVGYYLDTAGTTPIHTETL